MRYKLSINTRRNGDEVIQTITYNHNDWMDNTLKLGLTRKQIELHTKLELDVIRTEYEGKSYIRTYVFSNSCENLKRYDGNFYLTYRKVSKSCKNCVSYRRKNKYCTWKDEVLLKPLTRCVGFLEG